MSLDKSIIDTLLQEKGIMKFKPFYLTNSNKDVYAYYKSEKDYNYIHFCDSKLNELSRKDIGLDDGLLFILGTNENYSILDEYCHVKGHRGQILEEGYDDGWLIENDNKIKVFFLNGYFKISDKYVILESSIINICENLKFNIWKPGRDYYRVYNTETHEIDSSYYGSINTYHVLSNSKNGLFIIDEKGEIVVDNISAIWKNEDSIRAIKLKWHNKLYIDFTDLSSNENYGLNLPFSKDGAYTTRFCFWAENNILVGVYRYFEDFSNVDDNISFDQLFVINNNELLYNGVMPDNEVVESIKNGIITVKEEHKVWRGFYNEQYFQYSFYDYQYCKLGTTDSLKNKYIVISREYAKIGSPSFCKEIFYGILDICSMSVILPINYNEINILSNTDEELYAVIGFAEIVNDEKVLRYGLFIETRFVLPIENEEIRTIHKYNGLAEIIYKKDDKYGLVYKGKLCLNNNYTLIEPKNNFFLLGCGKKYGFYYLPTKYISPLEFDEITYVDNHIFVANNELYSYEGNETHLLTQNNDKYNFEDCTDEYYMFKVKNSTGKSVDDYICYYNLGDNEICEVDIEELDPYSSDFLDFSIDLHKKFFIVDGNFYYDLQNKCFIEFDDMLIESESYVHVYEDDYDYERDTYYALGGDDYDEWRENGGNLDDMMDGMGY